MAPRVLLINPNYHTAIFGQSMVRAATSPGIMPLSLPTLGASLRKAGIVVRLLDLNLFRKPMEELKKCLTDLQPTHVGFTFTTPLFPWVSKVAEIVREWSSTAILMGGGPHASALPEETLRESALNAVVKGEGDRAIVELVIREDGAGYPGISFTKDGEISFSGSSTPPIEDLDTLPFPAYELLDMFMYRQSRLASRKNPVAVMETSRGCYAHCAFCNKNIFGYKFRVKSPERVVDEMRDILGLGFREIHIIDDVFTADMRRAERICDQILARGLHFSWYPRGGIRVDRVTLPLLRLMKKAGCYRIPFGIESGCQKILDAVNKGTSLEEARNAVGMAKEAGLETECYFMIGLPGETEEDVKASIAFALSLDPDFVKFAITIPLPGTEYFREIESGGRLKTRDWTKFTFSTPPGEIYDHPCLDAKTLESYYVRAHRMFYLRPRYILRRAVRGMSTLNIFSDIKYLLSTPWWSARQHSNLFHQN